MRYFRNICLLILFIFASQSINCSKEKTDSEHGCRLPILDVRDELPVLAIYESGTVKTEDAFDFYDYPIVVLYADGQIIWDSDKSRQATTYCTSNVNMSLFDSLVSKLRKKQLFIESKAWEDNYGPSADYETIVISYKGDRLMWRSWHELVEEDPSLVALSSGSMVIPKGKTRKKMIANEPRQYRDFRDNWLFVRSKIENLIPKECQDISVKISTFAIETPSKIIRMPTLD